MKRKFFTSALHALFLAAAWLSISALFLLASCSSSPKTEAPAKPNSSEAGKFSSYGNAYFNEGQYQQAADMYLVALDRYIRIDNRVGAIRTYNAIAKSYLALDRAEEAEEILQRALQSIQAFGRPSSFDREQREAAAETYSNLGEVEYSIGEYEHALMYFDKGIAILNADDSPRPYAVLLHNRGTVLHALERSEQAVEDLNRALALNLDERALYEVASNYYMLARIALEQNQLKESKIHAEAALNYDKETEYSYGIAQDLFLLAKIAHRSNREDEALQLLARAEQIYLTLQLASGQEKVVEYRLKIQKE